MLYVLFSEYSTKSFVKDGQPRLILTDKRDLRHTQQAMQMGQNSKLDRWKTQGQLKFVHLLGKLF